MILDGGEAPKDSAGIHIECRNCGLNLRAEANECPDYGSDIAVYEL